MGRQLSQPQTTFKKSAHVLDFRGAKTPADVRKDQFKEQLRAKTVRDGSDLVITRQYQKEEGTNSSREAYRYTARTFTPFKILTLILIVALNFSGVFTALSTLSIFSDHEDTSNNAYAAGLVDFVLEVTPFSDMATATPAGLVDDWDVNVIPNDLSNPFYYFASSTNFSGNLDLCAVIEVEATLEGEVMYQGLLTELLSTTTPVISNWTFAFSNVLGFPGHVCEFDIDFNGWQTRHNLPQDGFTDTETVHFSLLDPGVVINKVFVGSDGEDNDDECDDDDHYKDDECDDHSDDDCDEGGYSSKKDDDHDEDCDDDDECNEVSNYSNDHDDHDEDDCDDHDDDKDNDKDEDCDERSGFLSFFKKDDDCDDYSRYDRNTYRSDDGKNNHKDDDKNKDKDDDDYEHDANGSDDGARDDWVELYNTATVPIDISGWLLCDNEECDVLPPTPPIPPEGFVLIAGSEDVLDQISVPDDVTVILIPDGTIGDGLDRDGDMLQLIEPAVDFVLDQMNWGPSNEGWQNFVPTLWDPAVDVPEEDEAMARMPTGFDTNEPEDWQLLSLPEVQIVYPGSSTGQWFVGDEYTIKWEAHNGNGDDEDLRIDIYYRTKEGERVLIVEGTENDGEYYWIVPPECGEAIYIEIVATGPENPLLNTYAKSKKIKIKCEGPHCPSHDVKIINTNHATVTNEVHVSANSGGNSSTGGAGGAGGSGENGGSGGSGGSVQTGSSTASVTIVNTVNKSTTTVTGCDCEEGEDENNSEEEESTETDDPEEVSETIIETETSGESAEVSVSSEIVAE